MTWYGIVLAVIAVCIFLALLVYIGIEYNNTGYPEGTIISPAIKRLTFGVNTGCNSILNLKFYCQNIKISSYFLKLVNLYSKIACSLRVTFVEISELFRSSCGAHPGLLWSSSGAPAVLLRCSCGAPAELLRCSCGALSELLRSSSGAPAELPRYFEVYLVQSS